MRIAVTYDKNDGSVFQHFGKTENYGSITAEHSMTGRSSIHPMIPSRWNMSAEPA